MHGHGGMLPYMHMGNPVSWKFNEKNMRDEGQPGNFRKLELEFGLESIIRIENYLI